VRRGLYGKPPPTPLPLRTPRRSASSRIAARRARRGRRRKPGRRGPARPCSSSFPPVRLIENGTMRNEYPPLSTPPSDLDPAAWLSQGAGRSPKRARPDTDAATDGRRRGGPNAASGRSNALRSWGYGGSTWVSPAPTPVHRGAGSLHPRGPAEAGAGAAPSSSPLARRWGGADLLRPAPSPLDRLPFSSRGRIRATSPPDPRDVPSPAGTLYAAAALARERGGRGGGFGGGGGDRDWGHRGDRLPPPFPSSSAFGSRDDCDVASPGRAAGAFRFSSASRRGGGRGNGFESGAGTSPGLAEALGGMTVVGRGGGGEGGGGGWWRTPTAVRDADDAVRREMESLWAEIRRLGGRRPPSSAAGGGGDGGGWTGGATGLGTPGRHAMRARYAAALERRGGWGGWGWGGAGVSARRSSPRQSSSLLPCSFP